MALFLNEEGSKGEIVNDINAHRQFLEAIGKLTWAESFACSTADRGSTDEKKIPATFVAGIKKLEVRFERRH
jgi:hypothetical protein